MNNLKKMVSFAVGYITEELRYFYFQQNCKLFSITQ